MSKKARRAAILISVLCLLFLLFLLLPQLLANWAEKQLAAAITESFADVSSVTVSVGKGSLVSWARGQLVDLRFEGRELATKDGFPLDAFFFEAKLIRIQLGTLIREGKVELLSSHGAQATVVLAQDSLSAYLQKSPQPLQDLRMELAGGKATLHGTAILLGQKVKLSIAGKFTPFKGELRFMPTDFYVANFEVPRFLLKALGKEVEFTIPLGNLPLPLKLESVRIENGHAYLAGRGDLE